MLEKYSLQPEKVFYYFEEISKIPRGSGNTKEVSDYCVSFACERGLYVRQDELNNVVIKKPATKGYEGKPGVIIQGHLDMVAEKDSDSNHDFMKDPIKLIVDGDFLTADKTTLGADDGIAVAMGLAILDSDDIKHPELEVIFTVDEETGMYGAMDLDMSDIMVSICLILTVRMTELLQ
ncbi:MAG: M20/M25/M40 family metallo-hydrolase [Lachnospiraceae bacterium]|nr:M20/M25/M40 family metallo-hydrolase [Lachnospiraceae bacterium]